MQINGWGKKIPICSNSALVPFWHQLAENHFAGLEQFSVYVNAIFSENKIVFSNGKRHRTTRIPIKWKTFKLVFLGVIKK